MPYTNIEIAADALMNADAVIFTTGAGMGCDSGLPDFRGQDGFWNAYPPLRDRQIDFASMANPRLFSLDPYLAWWFYGHRFNLYRKTTPHSGYHVQKAIADQLPHFVHTTNVDAAYLKCEFDPDSVCETHGSIFHWQTHGDECSAIFEAPNRDLDIDTTNLRARELPRTPDNKLARPNILMFGDCDWNYQRERNQYRKLLRFLDTHMDSNLVILECGAGNSIPTLRIFGERVARKFGATLIRINPREPEDADVCIDLGAAAALDKIAAEMTRHGWL